MKKLLILLLFPILIFSQESTLTGDLNCDNTVNGLDAEILQNLIFQIQDVNELAEEYPCFNDNVTGLTAEQLQELINMMDEQVNINYNSSGGNSNYPTMISSISENQMSWEEAIVYCAELEENGYDNWFLPDVNQLSYAVSGGCELPDERIDSHLWTRSPSYMTNGYIYRVAESSNGITHAGWNTDASCRCIRWGESETSASSSSSSSSSSSIENSSEQPITMIGPMFTVDEFPNFNNFNSGYNTLNWVESHWFCNQLEYGGYNDWYLPTYDQIIDYYLTNEAINIQNVDDFFYDNSSSFSFWTNSKSSNNSYWWIDIFAPEASLSSHVNTSGTSNTQNFLGCFCVR